MARITWFEYFTEDAEKDLAFYKQAFGWEAQQWGEMPYWLVITGDKSEPGIDGAIGLPPMAHPPGMATRAIPTRAISGPRTRELARMVFTISYLASGSESVRQQMVVR